MPISNQKLFRDIRKTFSKAEIFTSDADYMTPQKDWVSGDLYHKNFRKWLSENQLSRWKDYWDCDNFSFAFYSFAQICHARTMQNLAKDDRAQGLAIGVMFYHMEGAGGHAINFIHTNGEIVGFEPQNGKYINLTKKEKDSCWLALC